MFGISFLNPILLAATAVALLPIALHYITRRGTRILDFSTLMFLRQAIARKAKQFQLENRRLLLLRILAVALIAIALSRPVFRFSGTSLVRPGTHTTSVFIIDNSMSMAAIENTKSRFERAREVALGILDRLSPEDQVALFMASSVPQVIFGQPTSLIDECRDHIANAKVTYHASDIQQSLLQALDLLKKVESGAREIYIISDMQASPWAELAKIPADARVRDVNIYICDVGMEQSPNVAITGVSTDPAVARPDSVVAANFKVTNFSPYPSDRINLLCQFAASDQPRASISIEPGKTLEKEFRRRYTQSGVHTGFGRIDQDVLLEDNIAYFATLISRERSVLVLEGSPENTEGRVASASYLTKALELYGKGTADGLYLKVTTVNASGGLTGHSFSGYDMVVVSNVPRLSSDDVFRLRSFAQAGGGILIFLGDRVDADAWNREASPGLVPGRLVAVTQGKNRIQPDGPYALLERNTYEHPALALFRTLANGDLRLPEIYKHFMIEIPEGTSVLSHFGTGYPAILENPIGRGSAIIVAFSADTTWSNFPLRKIYLPFWAEVTRYLTSRTSVDLMHSVGQPVGIRVLLKNTVQRTIRIPVQRPDGETGEIQAPGDSVSGSTFYADTSVPGIYRISLPPGGPVAHVFPEAFAVNPDPGESNLTKIRRPELDKALEGLSYRYFDNPKSIAQSLSKARSGSPLWTGFLLLVLAVLVGETLYSHKVWR